MTDPKRAQWYVSVLNALDEFVVVKGERSRLLWANRAFCDYYGMDNATLASLIDAEHSDPDDTLKYVRDDHEVDEWKTSHRHRSCHATRWRGPLLRDHQESSASGR